MDFDRLTRSYGLERATPSETGPVMQDEEEAAHSSFPNISLVIGERNDQGLGTLHVTTRRIVWFSSRETSLGLAAPFSAICLHAVSQATETHQKPCIYIQLESVEREEDDDDDDEAEVDSSPEIRLVPVETSDLQDIFQSLCTCAALNPDSEQEEDEEDGDVFYDEEEVEEGASRAAMLDHLDGLLQVPRADELEELLAVDPSRFDDADDVEEDEADDHPNGVSPMQ